MPPRPAYTLLELNQYIRRVISLNFDQPIWIECEIGQASLSRGHWYLDLIQKDNDVITAQCQAAMWANVYFYLKRKSPVPPEEILQQGMAVKLKVNVDFHERYGLKLIIEDIDSSFTIGMLEMQRQAILSEIRKRNLIRKNAETYLPPVVQRLAIISSDRAAGWKDFVKHVEDNPYGYDIYLSLFEAAMQGPQVESEVLSCLELIEREQNHFDAVAILRGGGGRTDLAAFDNLPLAIRVAEFPIPVLIGIGHEIDQSVLDIVAYRSLKTPTAVADFIIERNADFEGNLENQLRWIQDEAMDRVRLEWERLNDLSGALRHGAESRLRLESQKLGHLRINMLQAGRNLINLHLKKLDFMDALLTAVNPDKVLARGYTITTQNGKSLTSALPLEQGMQIETIFHDGAVKSKIE
jgi:exodeoxyribonuclease VII large subunit